MDLKVIDGWCIVEIPKAILVLTKAELLRALRRGKWWRRRQAMPPRQAAMQATSAARREERGD